MILVECKPDRLLVQKLLSISKKQVIHKGNKTGILKKLKKSKNKIGLMDEDPDDTTSFEYLEKHKDKTEKNSFAIKHFVDSKNNNAVIILCPRLEDWIINAAHKVDKQLLKKYNLPDNGNKLHKIINQNLSKFEQVLDELIDTSSDLENLKKLFSQYLTLINT